MDQSNIFDRFNRTVADKAKANNSNEDANHKDMQHVLHNHMQAVHKVVFGNPTVTTFEEAKARHQTLCDLSKPNEEPTGK